MRRLFHEARVAAVREEPLLKFPAISRLKSALQIPVSAKPGSYPSGRVSVITNIISGPE